MCKHVPGFRKLNPGFCNGPSTDLARPARMLSKEDGREVR